MDDREGVGFEELAFARTRDPQAVPDVLDRILVAQGSQVEAQPHALLELHEFGRVDLVAKLRLPGEDDMQYLLARRLHAREQADLLEHLVAQVLRLVDDQEHLASLRVLLDQELVERRQDFRLAHPERAVAELDQHGLQELDRRDLRLVELRDHDVLVDLLEEALDQRRLARADFAGDHHEAVREPDGRFHVRLRTGVDLAQVEEGRVRAEAERQVGELEVFEVHNLTRTLLYGRGPPTQ